MSVLDNLLLRTSVFVNEIKAKAESLLANSKQNLTGKDNSFSCRKRAINVYSFMSEMLY